MTKFAATLLKERREPTAGAESFIRSRRQRSGMAKSCEGLGRLTAP